MLITKTTIGFVTQTFNAELGRFISQEFIAGDQVDVEDENGDPVDSDVLGEVSLLLEMVQPPEGIAGKCPQCGGSLVYGDSRLQDRNYVYKVSCPGCGFSGVEWYALRFTDFTDTAGNPVPPKRNSP